MQKFLFAISAFTLLLCQYAFASLGEGLPWETPLESIANSLTGPVAKTVGVISIAGTGLALAMGESGGLFRKLIQVVFGLAIAFAATTWGLGFLGFGSGLIIQ